MVVSPEITDFLKLMTSQKYQRILLLYKERKKAKCLR